MTGPEGVRILGPLTEWTNRVYEDVALTPEDRTVVEKWSASADSRLQIEELRRGLRVRTRSWVGVVRLPTVEMRIPATSTRRSSMPSPSGRRPQARRRPPCCCFRQQPTRPGPRGFRFAGCPAERERQSWAWVCRSRNY